MNPDKMTLVEQADLSKLEKVIVRGQKEWLEVGLALCEISDRKLYRQKYPSFSEYCQKRWGWSRQRGYEMIKTAIATQALPEKLSGMLDSPRVATAVANIPKERRQEVLENVVNSGKRVTAKAITDEAGKNKVHQAASGNGANTPDIILDEVAYPVPPEIVPLWERGGEVKRLLSGLTEVKRIVNQALKDGDPLYAELNNAVLADLTNAYNGVKRALPYAVCPKCQGRKEITAKCTGCKKRGIVSRFFWEQCVTQADKKLREKMAELRGE